MAIISTGAIYKSLIFDGEDSRDYGVYITGQAVYNAPERDVEMISIPGKNGSFALDKGRFQNIEVTYPAGIFADNEADFAQGISDFRNFLCSRNGYVRLTDDYNPDEYRMAVYKSGLDVSPAQLKAGEFKIAFDCKPQRYLTSGEEAIDVSSGDTITNPTLFEAAPMLEVEGYGEIGVNGDVITIQNGELGEIKISDATQEEDVILDVSNLNADDAIYSVSSQLPYAIMSLKLADASGTLNVAKRSSVTGGTAYISKINGYASEIRMSPVTTGGLSFRKGWSHTYTTTLPLTITINGTATNCTLTLTTVYNGGANTISLVFGGSDFPESGLRITSKYSHPVYYGSSTKVVLPSPMYIDLDLGEAYGEVSDEITSFNSIVQMPANPPTLKAGANEITFDDTITDLKVIPRWWRV